MFRRPPDRQRFPFYAMEQSFEWLWRHHHPRRRQPSTRLSWRAIEDYCEFLYDDAMARPYAHQLFLARRRTPLLIERLDASADSSWARPAHGHLGIHVDQRTVGTAIHEVAHLLAGASHDWRYASIYRQMIGRHVHAEAEQLLKTMYPWNGVRDRTRGIPDDGVPPYTAPAKHRAQVAA